jgi:glycosyltransferase involved in cell wall biosynthesis
LKVAFDSWVLASRLRHQGTYVYAQNLIAQFKNIAKVQPEVKFCLFTSPGAANDANSIQPGNGFELSRTGLLARDRLWRLGGVSLAAARVHADLIFSPTPSILPLGAVPVVCTIHDVTPIVMPSHSRKVTWLLRSLLWWSCKYSRAIITDSECSKRDLIRIYGLPESKVSVVYLGYDDAIFNDSAPDPGAQQKLLNKLGIARPYLLHHGIIQPRKNLKRLIEAYRLVLSRNRHLDFELVLAGPLGWEYEEIVTAAGNGSSRPGQVILPGALDDSDLATLIKGASLVVIPSLYEGFCLPMVEAMACGVPTIVAASSCLPEVSGGVLKYFDPLSVEDMASCLEQALESDETRKGLAQRGKERAAGFSWRRCAKETLAVLRKQYGSQENGDGNHLDKP